MTPKEAKFCKEYGYPYIPAGRTTIEKLVALAPERAEEFWKRAKVAPGFPKDEALALLAELQAQAKHRLPPQPIEVAFRTDSQSSRKAIEVAEAELKKAQAEKDKERVRQLAEMVN